MEPKGKTYEAKSLNCSMTDGNATITAVFPFLTEFDNVSMTLDINGERMTFDLEDFFNNAYTVAEWKQNSPATEDKSKEFDLSQEDIKVYLDGKETTKTEMQQLNPDKIASISVDKKENIIYITIKK